MQGRSWMAALTFTASALLGLGLGSGVTSTSRADDPKSTTLPKPPAPAPSPSESGKSKVKLDLAIAGLGPKGCDIEIAPGHLGCQFRPVSLHLNDPHDSRREILFEDVRATGADRYCLFAITIREPGQPAKTIRRGLRLVEAAPASGPSTPDQFQLLTCYVSSPSKLARASEMRERR
jgi:hypothetical protein